MNKNTKNQQGIGVVPLLLVLFIVLLICYVGWYVWKNKNKLNNTSVPMVSSYTSTNPTASWKTFTLKYEKLTFKYPPTWYVDDASNPNSRHDYVFVYAPDGFSVQISDGIQNGGDPLWVDLNNPENVTFLGKPYYLIFIHPGIAQSNGPPIPDTGFVESAALLANKSNQPSFPADKNVIGSSQYNGVDGPEGSYLGIFMDSKTKESVQKAKVDADFNYGKLLIQSMHY